MLGGTLTIAQAALMPLLLLKWHVLLTPHAIVYFHSGSRLSP